MLNCHLFLTKTAKSAKRYMRKEKKLAGRKGKVLKRSIISQRKTKRTMK